MTEDRRQEYQQGQWASAVSRFADAASGLRPDWANMRPWWKRLGLLVVLAYLAMVGTAVADFNSVMAAAAVVLTVAILSEAVAAAVTTVALSEVATITAVAGSYFAAGGALNIGIGLTLMSLPVVGLIAAVVAVGAVAVILNNIPAPTVAAELQVNAISPPDGTPPAVTALGFVGPNGTLLTLQVVGGRGSDPDDDLNEVVNAAIADGLTVGDVPGSPPGSSPGLGLGLDLSSPGESTDTSGDVGLFMVANPDPTNAVSWPSTGLLMLAGLAWLRRISR